jgi:hypothetical protein
VTSRRAQRRDAEAGPVEFEVDPGAFLATNPRFPRLKKAVAVRLFARALRRDARRRYGRAAAAPYLASHLRMLDATAAGITPIRRAVELALRSERARTFYRLRYREPSTSS